MSVTERVMAAGSWDLQLVADTPRRVLEAIDIEVAGFGQLVILPTRLDPRMHTDATMLGLARYTGLFRKQEGDFHLSGPGLPILLGDEDGKGDVCEVEWTTANGWLTEWVTSLRPMSLNAGTTYSPGGSYTGSFRFITAKKAFETVCADFGVEWRANPDFTLDVGSVPSLYGATPKLIILHNGGEGGRDVDLTGVQGVSGLTRDLEDYTTKIIHTYEVTTTTETEAVTDTGTPSYVWDEGLQSDVMTNPGAPTTSTITESTTTVEYVTAATAEEDVIYRRGSDGGPVILDRLVEGSADEGTDDDPQTLADMQLGRFDHPRREITVEAGDYDIGHLAPVGSNVYLYTPPVVMDASSPVAFRGRTCYPVTVRLMGMTWPIQRGLGVYLRVHDGTSPTWHDLTDFVEWESGGVQLEVDSLPRSSS